MKQTIIFISLALFSLATSAQEKKDMKIAEETTYTETKTGFTIKSSDKPTIEKMLTFAGGALKRYQFQVKTDRKGQYALYTFYFKNDSTANPVIAYFNAKKK